MRLSHPVFGCHWLLLATLALSGCGESRRTEQAPVADVADERTELQRLNREIAFYQKRVAEDPEGGLDRAQLGGLTLARARITGNHEDYRRAEQAALESLERLPVRNGRARFLLATSRLGQHRFVEAAAAARELCEEEPQVPAYRGLKAEILLELGQYLEADQEFAALANTPEAGVELELMVRLARWDEVNGRARRAAERLDLALHAAGGDRRLTTEQRAWFHFRRGDLALRQGDAPTAARQFRAGLAVRPHDRRLLTGLSRLAAAEGDWNAARTWARQATIGLPDPAAGLALATAVRALGDSAAADSILAPLRGGAMSTPFDRTGMALLVAEGRRLPEVVARLRREAEIRPDVYGLDLLAAALLRSGQLAEAASIQRRALSRGTEEPLFHYHAGLIARSLGQMDIARREFDRALQLSPFFPGADRARRLRDSAT